jgi:hypothetical protein
VKVRDPLAEVAGPPMHVLDPSRRAGSGRLSALPAKNRTAQCTATMTAMKS